MVYEAFLDYRLNALTLSALDQLVIGNIQELGTPVLDVSPDSNIWPSNWRGLVRCRERDECVTKLRRLKIIP